MLDRFRPRRERPSPYLGAQRWMAHPLVCICESPVCPFDHVTPMKLKEIKRRIGAS